MKGFSFFCNNFAEWIPSKSNIQYDQTFKCFRKRLFGLFDGNIPGLNNLMVMRVIHDNL